MHQIAGIGLSLCVLLILAACVGPSYQVHQSRGYGEILPGETWVAVDSAHQSPSREMVYYDPKTIRRDGDLVTLVQLTDYKWMQGNAPFGAFMMGPHRFFSTKTRKEFDCARNTVRLLTSSEFYQHMGTGTQNAALVEQGFGQPVEPDSLNQALWEVACRVTNTPG